MMDKLKLTEEEWEVVQDFLMDGLSEEALIPKSSWLKQAPENYKNLWEKFEIDIDYYVKKNGWK